MGHYLSSLFICWPSWRWNFKPFLRMWLLKEWPKSIIWSLKLFTRSKVLPNFMKSTCQNQYKTDWLKVSVKKGNCSASKTPIWLWVFFLFTHNLPICWISPHSVLSLICLICNFSPIKVRVSKNWFLSQSNIRYQLLF